jgi:NADH-quinone oxidoreductase subunit N
MSAADLQALLPLLLLGATPLAALLAIALRARSAVTALSVAGLVAALLALGWADGAAPRAVTPLLTVDRYALFVTGLLAAATLAVVLMGRVYFATRGRGPEEFAILALLAATGAAVLAASAHLASFFLGLELLSVGLYAMIGYLDRDTALEAALKYLVLAAVSAAFLLFGMALVYAALGTLEMRPLIERLGRPAELPLLVPGVALMIAGIGFKLAVVPFHLWTPDVYEGAPAPAVAFVATVSKGGMVALLLRLFGAGGTAADPTIALLFAIVAIASMIAGNLLALLQANVKRVLAYSSIAHLGYLLVAFQARGPAGATAALLYLVAYVVTMLGAFGVLAALSGPGRDADTLEDLRGLAARRPLLAGVFAAMLLSLAGIPLTAGFVGKFAVVAAGTGLGLVPQVIVLVATSAVGLFYYLRIVVALFAAPAEGAALPARLPRSTALVLGGLTLALVWLGIQPNALLEAIRSAVAGLG